MSKTVYSFQEIAERIRQGKRVSCTYPLTAQITLVQPDPQEETITVTIDLLVGEDVVGQMEITYTDVERFLDAFDVNVYSHVWEVLK